LGRYAHKRKAYFREYSIDELVPRPPAGKKMRAIVDLDYGDRVARDCGADYEIDAFPKHLVQRGLAFRRDPALYLNKFRKAHLHKYAVVAAQRLIQHGEEVFFIAGQEPAAHIARASAEERALEICNNQNRKTENHEKVK
jgi:hypothetical protein